MTDIRIIPSAALTVTALALAAFVVQQPRAAMWAAVVALILAVLGLFTQAVESVRLREGLADKDEHIAELEDEATRLHVLVTELQIAGGDAIPLPRLHVVEQSTGEHDRLALSREEWAAIERETEGL